MPVRLVISICHPLLLVSCNDRRGVDYATTLTQALLQVLLVTLYAAFFSNSHVLTRIPMHTSSCDVTSVKWASEQAGAFFYQ